MSLVTVKVMISLATASSLCAFRRMALKWSLNYCNKHLGIQKLEKLVICLHVTWNKKGSWFL